MNSTGLLLLAPGFPLLLAIPALRRHLPWPAYIALLPATVLLFSPAGLAVELPWVLFGSAGLGFEATTRWWLAMSLVAWMVAAFFLQSPDHPPARESREMTWFMLCLGGQSGALLATDMVTFFTTSSLMGYAFYGLLSGTRDRAGSRAGRLYLVALVSADLLLFEALLVAASATQDLGFEQIATSITPSSSIGLYLAMVIIGFTLKAGLWPLQLWLPPAYGSARPATVIVLWVAPVATGLLGMVRWLPLGETADLWTGALLQGAGGGGVLYGALFGLRQEQWSRRIAYLVIMATGATSVMLGAGLADPLFWTRYGELLPFALIGISLGLCAVVGGRLWRSGLRTSPPGVPETAADAPTWLERKTHLLVTWGQQAGNETLPRLCTAWSIKWRHFWSLRGWEKYLIDPTEHALSRWTISSLLFLLLAILTTGLVMLANL